MTLSSILHAHCLLSIELEEHSASEKFQLQHNQEDKADFDDGSRASFGKFLPIALSSIHSECV